MPLGPGARPGPYEIVAAIGAGGMGEGYKARDTRLDRIVAIKIRDATGLPISEALKQGLPIVETTRRERLLAKTLRSISSSTLVAAVLQSRRRETPRRGVAAALRQKLQR